METATTATSWSDLNLNEINVEASASGEGRRELPAPATYKLRLAGAKHSPFQAGTTDIDFVVIDGPFTRQHLFATLPSPSKGEWVAKAAALLIKRLGGSQLAGEDLVDTLSRIAANGASPITADVAPDTYVSKNTGETVTKPKLQYFSIQAA